jgi:hypothetical protein
VSVLMGELSSVTHFRQKMWHITRLKKRYIYIRQYIRPPFKQTLIYHFLAGIHPFLYISVGNWQIGSYGLVSVHQGGLLAFQIREESNNGSVGEFTCRKAGNRSHKRHTCILVTGSVKKRRTHDEVFRWLFICHVFPPLPLSGVVKKTGTNNQANWWKRCLCTKYEWGKRCLCTKYEWGKRVSV